MQISLLILVSLPLLFSPLLTYRIYDKALSWERTQIAVDNAAIVIGKKDKELFNYLIASNRILHALEMAHHPLHFCARVPLTTAFCISEDLVLEAQITAMHHSVYLIANTL